MIGGIYSRTDLERMRQRLSAIPDDATRSQMAWLIQSHLSALDRINQLERDDHKRRGRRFGAAFGAGTAWANT